MKKWMNSVLAALLVMCAFASCDSNDEEVVLSLTKEEMDATVTGSWRVQKAGGIGSTDAGQEHITDAFASSLDHVDIDPEKFVFHFNSPVKVVVSTYDMDGWNPVETVEEVTEYTVMHNDYHETRDVRFGIESNGDPFFYVDVYPDGVTSYSWPVYMVLFGNGEDESRATEILLQFTTRDVNPGIAYSLVRM